MWNAIIPHLDEAREEPQTVVLYYFKATCWNDNVLFRKTSLQSNFELSKVYINPVSDEFAAFREQLESVAFAAGELTQGSVDVIKIEDAIKAQQEGTPWIAGRVLALNVGEVEWCYKACGKCGKKVETAPKGKYECKECNHTNDGPKYK
ncbi:hypothetical protein PIB30_104365 [Stylosanthes scabra]|uniref:Uncharacterized protein n=1 Tax=Stylosanthes scabra TaxID=79078 RepID=A0ABU6V0B6_9FABA|nr:hypothetical protein [Stylosanthes scabra]